MSGLIETKPDPVLRCERCGAALAAADSLCDCDAAAAGEAVAGSAALSAPGRASSASAAAKAGTHVCPACGGRFGSRELRVFHAVPDAPWYRFTRFGKACPHCTTPLRSRHPLGWPRRALPAAIMGLILGSHLFGLLPPYEGWLRTGLWLAFLLQLLDNQRRESRDPQAYERDPRWS